MRYDLWRGEGRGVYLGGAQTRQEVDTWARRIADRTDQPVTISRPSGKVLRVITPRGARSALNRR